MEANKLPEDPQLLDLLIERATFGLDTRGERRARSLARRHGNVNLRLFEHTVAVTQLSMLARRQGMRTAPESLKTKLRALAADHLAGQGEKSNKVIRLRPAAAPTSAGFNRLGWYAVAAMLLILLWQGVPLERLKARPDPGKLRAALLSTAPDVYSAHWSSTGELGYESVTGDVVWSDSRQEGYMRLAGLPANASSAAQYQLWIVDPNRDKHPVDGGVFDVLPGPTEMIIPIRAALQVSEPAAFAITLEQPGGVVVSDGPLLLVASR